LSVGREQKKQERGRSKHPIISTWAMGTEEKENELNWLENLSLIRGGGAGGGKTLEKKKKMQLARVSFLQKNRQRRRSPV